MLLVFVVTLNLYPENLRSSASHILAFMAEREGFEPSVPLLAGHTISSRAPSANSGISPRSLLFI